MNEHVQATRCLNCDEALSEGKNFCAGCGQKAATHRLTTHEIAHDTIHAFTHADKGFFYLIGELAIKPGKVAKDYLAGRRKRYYNPFSFMVIITGVLVLISSNLNIFGNNLKSAQEVSVDYSNLTPKQQQRMEAVHKRSLAFSGFINKHVNIVLFISTPFMAFLFWLFYKKRKLYYAEHLTAVVFFNSFLMIITGVVFAPLIYFTRNYDLYGLWMISMLVLHVLYMAFAYKQLLDMEGFRGYFKTLAISLAAIICWVIFSGAVGTVYIMFGH